MEKKEIIICIIFLALIAAAMPRAFGDSLNTFNDMSLDEKQSWLDYEGIVFTGGDLESVNFDEGANSYTISEGTLGMPESFDGEVKIEGGTLKLSDGSVFEGLGSYSRSGGFSIIDGYLNGIHITDALSVYFDSDEGKISGIAGDNFGIEDKKIGRGTQFTYSGDGKSIALKGRPGITTIKDSAITKSGSDYYLGSMKLNAEESSIYLAKGDKISLGSHNIGSRNNDVKLNFEKEGLSYTITPQTSASGDSSPYTVKIYDGLPKFNLPTSRIDNKVESDIQRDIGLVNKNMDQLITDRNGASRPLSEVIQEEALKNGINPELLKGVIAVESKGDVKDKTGPSYGPGQMTPIAVARLKEIDKSGNWNLQNVIESPAENIRASAAYLGYLVNTKFHNEDQAVIAYKIGETKASRISENILPQSAKYYVKAVNGYRNRLS